MDPKLKEQFDAIRLELGKNVEALKRVDELARQAEAGAADVKAVRDELKKIQEGHAAREKEIKDLQQAMRVQTLAKDPIVTKRQALEMLGKIGRSLLSRHLNMAVPARFAGEAAEIEAYNQQRATLEEGAVSGSYFIPTILETQEIIDTLEEVSEILGLVDFRPGMPTKCTIPTFVTRPTLQPKRASSDTAMSASDPAFSYMTIDTEEGYIFFPVDNWLLELSPYALGSYLVPMLRDAYLDGLTKWVVLADGTATYNSLTGIINEATYVTSMPAGKMAFGDLAKSDLTAVKAATLKRGRARGRWLMGLDILGVIEDMDRTGKVPVVTYAQDGTPRILQNPVLIDESMLDLGDSAKSKTVLTFGDLSAMLVAMAGNGLRIATSTEFYFNRNQTCFRAMAHIDIKRKPANILRCLKTAAA